MRKALAVAVAAGALAALLAGPAAAQCVMCKTALSGSAEGRAVTAQFNRAILLMVFAPYFVVGGFLMGVYRERIARQALRHAAHLGAAFRARLQAIPTRWTALGSRARR